MHGRTFCVIATALSLSIAVLAKAATYSATYLPYNAPKKSEVGQSGTNQCGTESSQTSMCQNAYLSAWDDFCLWAPPATTSSYGDSKIANTEQIEVAWCLRSGYGTRVIPEGAITGVHFVQTPDYVQISGVGDLTKLNIPNGDDGGELDPHGYDGNGNPIGGLVFGHAYNGTLPVSRWTNFMSWENFCFRACPDAPNAPKYCQHIYDTLGCGWNMPGDYSKGFTSCEGNSTEPMGVYGTSTFHQGDPSTPPAHPAGPTSQCQTFSTFSANLVASTPTASLFPSSVSASLSLASLSSVSVASTAAPTSTTTIINTSTASVAPKSGGARRLDLTGSGFSLGAVFAGIVLGVVVAV